MDGDIFHNKEGAPLGSSREVHTTPRDPTLEEAEEEGTSMKDLRSLNILQHQCLLRPEQQK